MPRSAAPQNPSASPGSRRRLVLVAGAGRSGTSTVAGVLQRLGLVVPQPEVLTDETNPKGFSESQWVVDFHDDLLMWANVQVSDARPLAWTRTSEFANRPGAPRLLNRWLNEQFAESDELLIKDPRLSWFLPLWTQAADQVGAEPSFITMLRPPAEIVGSKRTYYNSLLQDGHGVAAWLNMMLNTERATRGSARAFVRYHDLLNAWEPVMSSVGADLGLSRLQSIDRATRDDIDAFVDPGLRRISLTWEDLDLPERLATMARSAWSALDQLPGASSDTSAISAELDEIHEAYSAYYLESEVVARSSIIAARTARDRQGPSAPVPVSPRSRLRASAVRAARHAPRWMRRLVPPSARAPARALLASEAAAPGTRPTPPTEVSDA